MAADPSRVIVTTGATPDAVRVHHRDFPELQADGESAELAAANLAQDLSREIDVVADDLHREPLQQALADVRAFLERSSGPEPPRGRIASAGTVSRSG
jgi:ribosomal protein L25 (general stress protein Ctc)